MKQFAILMIVVFLGITGFLIFVLARPAKTVPTVPGLASGPPSQTTADVTPALGEITVSQIQPLAEIKASEDINSLVFSQDQKTGYIPSFDEGLVYVFDVAGDKVTDKIKLNFPKVIELDPLKPTLYVGTGEKELLFYSLDSKKIEKAVSLGDTASDILIEQDGNRAFVALELTNRVAVIDLQSGELLTMIGVGNKPKSLAAKGRNLYVTNYDEASVSLISFDSLTEIARLAVGGRPNQVVADPQRERLYISDSYNSQILVLDSSTNSLLPGITTAQYPMGLEFDSQAHNLYVTGFAQNTLSILDLDKLSLIRTIETSSVFDAEGGFSLIKLVQSMRKFYLVNTLNGKVLVYSF